MDINTTPLIDVMLVLLIMFIITIPLQTHAVKLDLPTRETPPSLPNPIKNKVVVAADGAILWNGTRVSPVELRQYLEFTTTMTPVPELHVQPHPIARYEAVDEVLAIIKGANVTAMGFVGNEAYGNF